LVDELLWFCAPKVLGAEGLAAIVGPSPETPDDAPQFALADVTRLGDDVLLRLLPKR